MNAPELLEPTRSAHWGWDEHRYFGYRVFAELTGQETLAGLTALSVLGRRLEPEDRAVIDDAACALTLADPRIWPLKLTRVVAAYGSTLPAAAAGLLVMEDARIGPWTTANAAELLIEFRSALGERTADPASVRELVLAHLDSHRFIWGFGTPFRDRDERLVAFRACLRRRERDGRPYVRLMDAVVEVVRSVRHVEPNIGLGVAAAFLDMGFTPHQVGSLSAALMQHIFLAHAVEGSRNGATLRELPQTYVKYAGRAPRASRRARATVDDLREAAARARATLPP